MNMTLTSPIRRLAGIHATAVAAAVFSALVALPVSTAAQSSAASVVAQPTVRIRGTVVYADATSLIVKERKGEVISLTRADKMPVSEVYPIKLADIKQGSFVGAAAMPQANGTQKAIEVLVFPEAARGWGEGHGPWDLQPQSTMTNATVADMAPAPATVRGGKELRLSYKGGEKTVIVPKGVPIVTFRPGDGSLLVPGAKVLVTAQEKDGTSTALRVLAGRNGFTPPM